MRILVVHCTYLYKGGEDTVVQEEAKLLQQNGHIVEVLYFTNATNQLLKLLQLPFNFSSYFRIKKKIKQFEPDVVHIHNLHFAASPSVVYAAKHCNVPVVFTLHNYRLLCPSATLFVDGKLFLNSLQEDFPWTAVKKGVYKDSKLITLWLAFSTWLHQRLGTFNNCDKLICLTEHAKQLFAQSKFSFTKGQLVIKPNFSTTPSITQMNRGDHFLYVGRLTEEKGVTLLLETFAQTKLSLVIAGDGPLKDEVQSFSASHPNIKYVGNLNRQQVNEAMNKATALIFPSQWYEGMPLTIIEAFACGLPVIASDLGAMQSMIQKDINGFVFKPGSTTDLQTCIAQWHFLSEDEKKAYRENARASYEDLYSPEKNIKQLLNIYNSLISKHARPIPSLV